METANEQVLIAVKELHDFVAKQMAEQVVRGERDFVRVFLTDAFSDNPESEATLLHIAEVNPSLLERDLFQDDRGLAMFFDTVMRPGSAFSAALSQKLGHPAEIVIVARELSDAAQGTANARVAIDIRGPNLAISTTHAIQGAAQWREMRISPFPLKVPEYWMTNPDKAPRTLSQAGRSQSLH